MISKLEKGSRLEGQKFAVGDRVKVADEMPSWKAHFRHGEEATIRYSYGQVYGIEDDVEDYCIEFDDGDESAWYDENELIPIKKKGFIQKIKEIF